jgi:hypothetical protein
MSIFSKHINVSERYLLTFKGLKTRVKKRWATGMEKSAMLDRMKNK